jgi:hypothetical protein
VLVLRGSLDQMSDSDKNYIIWIANRLVYKYGENNSILTNVRKILNRLDVTKKDKNNIYEKNKMFENLDVDRLFNP